MSCDHPLVTNDLGVVVRQGGGVRYGKGGTRAERVMPGSPESERPYWNPKTVDRSMSSFRYRGAARMALPVYVGRKRRISWMRTSLLATDP